LSGKPFNVDDWTFTDPQVEERLTVVPRKIQKRREQFVIVPWMWIERLADAPGQTWHLAVLLLYAHWKGKGEPIKLANGMLKIDGVPRRSKWRALRNLERLALITVECRPRRSPVIHVKT
jgi:hypothetical protein